MNAKDRLTRLALRGSDDELLQELEKVVEAAPQAREVTDAGLSDQELDQQLRDASQLATIGNPDDIQQMSLLVTALKMKTHFVTYSNISSGGASQAQVIATAGAALPPQVPANQLSPTTGSVSGQSQPQVGTSGQSNPSLVQSANSTGVAAQSQTHENTAVFSIHGILSENQGLSDLVSRIAPHLPGIKACFLYGGKFSTFAKLSPQARQLTYMALRLQMKEAVYQAHQLGIKKIYIVAHSFGTLGLVHSLQMLVPNLVVNGVVLEASVLERVQNWQWLHTNYGNGGDVPVLNIVRPLDLVPRLGKYVGGGDSGRWGFIPQGWQHNAPIEIFKTGGHSDYVNDDKEVAQLISGGALLSNTLQQWEGTLTGWDWWKYQLYKLL